MKLEVVTSPQFDLCFALADAASPNPHFEDWAKDGSGWLDEARQFGWVFWLALPELTDRSRPAETVKEFIAALEAVPAAEVSPRLRHALVNRPSSRTDSAQMREWLHFIGFDSPEAEPGWGEPGHGSLDLPLSVLNTFRPHFEKVWDQLRPRLKKNAERTAELASKAKLSALAGELGLLADFDDRGEMMRTFRGYKVRLSEIGTMFLLPSVFNSRRFMSLSEFTTPRSLYIPYLLETVPLPRGIRRTADFGIDVDPWVICRAIGNPTRTAILQLIAARPRPAFEIMRELKLSKANVSHHIFQLREAGLIIEKRVGRSVELAVRFDPMRGLSRALLRELGERK